MIRVKTPSRTDRSPLLPAHPAEGSAAPETPGSVRPVHLGPTRSKKPIFVNRQHDAVIDPSVVSSRFYDAFNYTLEGQDLEGTSLVLGVTSVDKGEGKTFVAANFAVSLALSTERRTALVDLQLAQPRLHTIFGVPQGPGLLESLGGDSIEVWETPVPHLNLLTAGAVRTSAGEHRWGTNGNSSDGKIRPILRLNDLGTFRDVVASLRDAFEFLVIDLPSQRGNHLPTVFFSEVDGFVVVVVKERTRMEDLHALVRRLDQHRILGFVMNQEVRNTRKRWF